MIQQSKIYVCDDCGRTGAFTGYRQARRENWAVAKDYTKCYCPDCAPNHRRGNAANKQTFGELPNGWQQLKIDNL